MEQFNTGSPPASEAGMLVIRVQGIVKDQYAYWARGLRWRAPSLVKAVEHQLDDATGGQEGWRWATSADFTAAGISDTEARKMLHRSQLPDAPWLHAEKLEPTTAEVEDTQNPHTPMLDTLEDALAANKPMFDRDLIEPSTKPQPVAVERVPVNPFLVCAAWTNRLGGWGASCE